MYEVRHVLVPTDFSVHAEAALEHAVYMGERYNAEITILHVDEFVVSPLGARAVEADYIFEYQRKKMEFLEQEFARLRDKYSSVNVRLKTQVAIGRSYKVIIEESERQAYDMVVIATRGLTGLSTYLIGSTAERVVRLSRQPVLSIQDNPRREAVRSILCPTDLSPAGNVALSYALSIARQNNAKLYIQYISELQKPEDKAEVMRRMPDLAEHHPRAAEVDVQYLIDRDVEPSNSIIRFAEDRGVGLIVMSAHGRKGLRRVYIGNTTAEVVRQSTTPVLTVTHPYHKLMFSRPVTEKAQMTVPSPEEPRRKRA